ncbi:MAG TPA: DNA adenine methylase [Candidatus Nanopelagicaceae bacterium]|nr:DNA adenine methylase [Candidatus Nanopelagicaceae bacterium]
MNQIISLKGEISRIINKPYPFVKWAGGKRQLINQMKVYFPKNFNKYIEPFVGGGAVFFHLLPKKAILSDSNLELINCYNVIKYNVKELIESLSHHKYEEKYYYQIRAMDRDLEFYKKLSNIEKASRTIYLNKTGYNGLYRVNSKGYFNVPFGFHKNPTICDRNNLIAVHSALRNVKINHNPFESCLKFAERNDFIYFDPPYHPLSETSNFTSYNKGNFGEASQNELFNNFKILDERGCKLLLSNSYSDYILNLYRDYEIIVLKARRSINSNAQRRGLIKEVLIKNKFKFKNHQIIEY